MPRCARVLDEQLRGTRVLRVLEQLSLFSRVLEQLSNFRGCFLSNLAYFRGCSSNLAYLILIIVVARATASNLAYFRGCFFEQLSLFLRVL